MEFAVGTTNAAKLDAVREILAEYPHLKEAAVASVKTESGVADQPKSLEETIRGAINRARTAHIAHNSVVQARLAQVRNDFDISSNRYGVGIESGLMEVPYTKGGYMDVCACAIFDGNEFHLGLSSAWEFPDPKITQTIMSGTMDMSQAINHHGLTTNPAIGAAEGAIGILTKGRVNRKEYTKQALRMALIHLDQNV